MVAFISSSRIKLAVLLTFGLFFISMLAMNLRIVAKFDSKSAASFEQFNPFAFDADSCGTSSCHGSGPTYIYGPGSIVFYAPTQVNPGETFSVNLFIVNFIGVAGNDTSLGLKSDLGDNLQFFSGTRVITSHSLDSNGNSTANATLSNLVAPVTTGNYTLVALAIAWVASSSTFHYINATRTIEVSGQNIADTTAPQINFVHANGTILTNGTILSEIVPMSVNITEENPSVVEITLANQPKIQMTFNNVSLNYEYNLSTFTVANGATLLIVNASDISGNFNFTAYNVTIQNTGIKGDITSYKMYKTQVIIGDQKISTFWDDIEPFQIPEYSKESIYGFAKSAHDNYYIYFLLAFHKSAGWIAIEFNATEGHGESMIDGHDGWAFGTGEENRVYEGDLYYVGKESHPIADDRNDISYEKIVPETGDLIYIELKRPLITNDPDGKDLSFEEGKFYKMKFASNILPTYHKSGSRAVYSLALSQMVPVSDATQPTTPTTGSKSLEQIKNENITNLFLLAGSAAGLNVILLGTIFVVARMNRRS
jgi:hypothetical protein